MPQRLSGLDATWIYLETRTAHMHVGSVIVLDPSTAPGGTLTRDAMAEYLRTRLHLAPPFRRRLVQVPLRLAHPLWIEDPDFDLDHHVRRAVLPAPGGLAELAELAGDVMGRQLDRTRPLWELWVVEGLEDGRVALITKTHHAAVDGVSGMELATAILQFAPDQQPPPPQTEWEPEAEPGDLRLLVGAGVNAATFPLQVARTGRRAVESAAALLAVGRRQDDPPPAPFAAPPTPWNGAIGPHRRVALAELALDDVKRIKGSLGGTVNDVVLAAVAGSLRSYLLAAGDPADAPLVAMVPISVRTPDQSGAMGNRVSSMLVALPSDVEDPVERLERVTRSTAGAKQTHGALGAETIQQVAELAPASIMSLAARLYTRTRAADRHRPIWNTVVSNVPGPRFPLWCAAARLEAMYPLGPIHEMNGLNITLFSYLDTVFVGINADRDLLPDVDRIAAGLLDAVAAMAKAADQRV